MTPPREPDRYETATDALERIARAFEANPTAQHSGAAVASILRYLAHEAPAAAHAAAPAAEVKVNACQVDLRTDKDRECFEDVVQAATRILRSEPAAAPAAETWKGTCWSDSQWCAEHGQPLNVCAEQGRAPPSEPAAPAHGAEGPGQCNDLPDCDAAYARIAELERAIDAVCAAPPERLHYVLFELRALRSARTSPPGAGEGAT